MSDIYKFANVTDYEMPLGNDENGIDWMLVGKGMALSMGQGIQIYL